MGNDFGVTKKKESIPSRALKGYNRCSLRRERDIYVKEGKGIENVYEKAVLIKDLIRKALFHVTTDEEIEATLELSFQEMDYPTKETAKLHAADAYRQIMRYVSCEKRTPKVMEAKVVRLFDLMNVKVKPDYVFKGVKDFLYEWGSGKKKVTAMLPKTYIEVVKICCRKPDVSLTGKYKDTGMMQCLELYAMLLYARSLAEPGERVNVCASYYFLRKNSDNSATKQFDQDFFENKGVGNVVTMWEEYEPGEMTDLDRTFRPQFEEFLDGEEVSGNTCDGCDFQELCHYTRPPKRLETEESLSVPAGQIRLTRTQEEVVNFRRGIACVNAGAGAGKTTSIALRAANMIKETGRPEKICMLTFTNTGAEEMRDRIGKYARDIGCGKDISRLTSTTFHAFGYQIVKENYWELGFTEEPKLIDDIDRSAVIAGILKEKVVPGLDYRNFYTNMKTCRGALAVAKKAFEIIKKEKLSAGDSDILHTFMPSGYFGFMDSFRSAEELLKLYQEYDRTLKSRNLIEYADQELLVFEILNRHPDYFVKAGYEHIIVDEFQDTNELQFELLKHLIDTPSFQSFMVVGDDSQSIFAFRGSSPDYIIHFFQKLHAVGKQFNMVENHRSTPQIIEFANTINSYNEHRVIKDLEAVKPDGDRVRVSVFWKRGLDLGYAIETIKKEHDRGTAYEDIAYIAFTRSELLKMGTMLTGQQIPWVMLNPEPMLENSRVLAALSLVKFICDPDATRNALIYLNAVWQGNLLKAETDQEVMQEIRKLDKAVNNLLEAPEEQQRGMFLQMLRSIDEEDEVYQSFIKMVEQKQEFEEMLDYCRLFETYGSDQLHKREHSYPGVVLTTAHSSKGKEWPVVINGLNQYHSKEIGKRIHSPEFEERRRLLFVSATKAKERLYIVGQAAAYGSKQNKDRELNQFLIESCKAAGTPFPMEPEEKKRTSERKAG